MSRQCSGSYASERSVRKIDGNRMTEDMNDALEGIKIATSELEALKVIAGILLVIAKDLEIIKNEIIEEFNPNS